MMNIESPTNEIFDKFNRDNKHKTSDNSTINLFAVFLNNKKQFSFKKQMLLTVYTVLIF